MDDTANWSVTLTGKTIAGADPQTAWQRVAETMKLDADTFRTRILQRVPLTLKAVGEPAALGQRDALRACGVEAFALTNPGGRYLWLQQQGEVRGPVSEGYLRQALESGALDRQARVCVKGEQDWQTLEAALSLSPLASAALHLEEDTPPAAAGVPAPPRAQPRPAAHPDAIRLDVVDVAEPVVRHARVLPENAAGLYGGFWMRVAAYALDMLIIWLAFFVLFFVLALMLPHRSPTAAPPSQVMPTVVAFLLILATWLYFPLWESSAKQATPGKQALGLRVTDENGNRLGFWHAFGRFLGKIVSGLILYVGYMMAGWTSRKQGLHDLMAGTFVVRGQVLEAWEQGEHPPGRPTTPMPAWAIVLIVLGAGFFLIVPIMAAIAIPAYQSYVVRAQTMEAVALTQSAKIAVTNYLLTNGTPPADNAQAGLGSPEQVHGRYVSSVSIVDGTIVASFGDQAATVLHDKHLTLTPALQAHGVSWSCASEDIPNQYLPLACQTH
ncbi:MAG TPA: RDD family protein [Dyella sp.]|uniref:RDD family protein n=1 Tax=Dyella sp. TaxID=1869338 RepID=UPI002BC80667|nr:RDD family protein [Dyella sp.]HTV85067.1 RDD family protein [Dyella sp.]